MGALAGYGPDAILRMLIAGFLGLVAISCGIALMLDAVRWMAGEEGADTDRQSVGSMARALKDKVILAVAIVAIAGSGATLSSTAARSAGSEPSQTIEAQGNAGWMVEGTVAGNTPTMGEALNAVADATYGQTFEGQVQQDYENRVDAGASAIVSAVDHAAAGGATGSLADAAAAGGSLSTAILEDMWLGDNAAGIRNMLSGDLLGSSMNGWREVANWIATYQDSYEKILAERGGG